MVSFGVHIFRPINGYYRGAVAYSGFHNEGTLPLHTPVVCAVRGSVVD